MLENQPVLTSARLALIAIAQHILRLRRLLRNKRPLHPGREPGPAASAQPRILHFINDRIGLHPKRLPHGLIAVQFEITVDVGRTLAEAPGDDLYLIGMGHQRSHFVIW